MMRLSGEYFMGNRISEHGLKHGYLDYYTLSKAFYHIHNDLAINWFRDHELVSGDWSEDNEVLRWYLVTESGAEILQEIGEIVFLL